jgi:hypothetical protein
MSLPLTGPADWLRRGRRASPRIRAVVTLIGGAVCGKASLMGVDHHTMCASHEAHPRGPRASSRLRRGHVKTDLVAFESLVPRKNSNESPRLLIDGDG